MNVYLPERWRFVKSVMLRVPGGMDASGGTANCTPCTVHTVK